MNILVYHYLPKKQGKPKNSSVVDHFIFCNHLASYDDFIIAASKNRKFLLELKRAVSNEK